MLLSQLACWGIRQFESAALRALSSNICFASNLRPGLPKLEAHATSRYCPSSMHGGCTMRPCMQGMTALLWHSRDFDVLSDLRSHAHASSNNSTNGL